MSVSKSPHVVIGNDEFRCVNCGVRQALAMPISINVLIAAGEAFRKDHARCVPTPANRPEPVREGASTAERLQWWVNHGERGSSSNAIAHHLGGSTMGLSDRDKKAHPWDADDLRRCVLLTDAVPEFEARIGEMATVSPRWARFAVAWPTLVAKLREEMAVGATAPQTYALIRSVIETTEAT